MEEIENSYHNTIFYTDFVIGELIRMLEHQDAFLFFVSDHGSNLGPFYTDYEVNANIPNKGMSDIAMFAWASDEFLKYNLDKWVSLKDKRDDRISQNYVFHSLLGCNNVESELVDQKRNLCANNR